MIYAYQCRPDGEDSCGMLYESVDRAEDLGPCECGSGTIRRDWGAWQLDSRATPNRRRILPSDPSKINWISKNEPSWEKGIAGEHRPGGTFMPYIDREGQPIHVKAFGENRHRLEAARRDIAQEVSAR